MKRIIIRLSFLLVMISLVISAAAQATQNCGEGPAEHTETLEPPLCYPKADYPERWQAVNQFEQDVLGFVSCTNNCPLPDKFDCEPKFIRFTQGGPVTETEDAWCFSGEIKFEWKCTDCTRKKIDTVPEEEVEDGDGLNDPTGGDYRFGNVEISGEEQPEGHIKRLYPNPSTGFFHTEIHVTEDNSKVELIINNLAGKTVFEKEYQDVPRSVFNTKNDLSTYPQGLYILSVKVNGILIGTSRLSVMK